MPEVVDSAALAPERAALLPIVVIVGPTGAGKSDVAIELAERVGGEIVSADSQQVYRGMDIGTGKVEAAVRARIRHHLIDVIEPSEEMTAARFAQMADAAIAGATSRGNPVIVAGGTGLYVRILLFGLFDSPGRDEALRDRLQAEAAAGGGAPALWQRLHSIDPACAERIECNDMRRIVRALEVYELTGVLMSEHQKKNDFRALPMRYRARIVGVAPPRDELYRRINVRVDSMIAEGLEQEVRALRARGIDSALRSQAAIGYAEMHRALQGDLDLAAAITLIKRNSRRYARRQLSWYRGDERVAWSEAASDIDLGALERYLRS